MLYIYLLVLTTSVHYCIVTIFRFDSSWLSPCSAGWEKPVKTTVGGGLGGRRRTEDGSRFSHLNTGFWLSQTFAQLRDTRAAFSPRAPPWGGGNLHAAGLRPRDGVGAEVGVAGGPPQTTDESQKRCRSPCPSLRVPEQAERTPCQANSSCYTHTPRVVFLLAYCSYALIPK